MHPVLLALQSLKNAIPDAASLASLTRQLARPVRKEGGTPAPHLWENQWQDILMKSLSGSVTHQVRREGQEAFFFNRGLDTSFFDLHAVAGAMLTWDQTRFIYRMDPGMIEMLGKTEGVREIPMDKLRHLPSASVFVEGEFPYVDAEGNTRTCVGFWACVQETKEGQVKLKIAPLLKRLPEAIEVNSQLTSTRVSTWEIAGIGIPIIGFGASDDLKTIEDKMAQMNKDLGGNPSREAPLVAFLNRAVNALIYLGSSQPDVTARPPEPATQSKKKANQPPPKPLQVWDVGLREGAVWRQAQEAQAAYDADHPGESGRSMRPHWRAAHWHGYWTGPRDSEERGLVIKWIAPVLVQARLAIETGQDLPAVRRRVRPR